MTREKPKEDKQDVEYTRARFTYEPYVTGGRDTCYACLTSLTIYTNAKGARETTIQTCSLVYHRNRHRSNILYTNLSVERHIFIQHTRILDPPSLR